MENEIVSGQQSTWTLIKKMGEGDAGEVYFVESLAGDRAGMLKRPQKSAFTGDVLRQAAQIKNEGLILKALSSLNASGDGLGVKVPELLDQSKPGADFGDHLFIVQAIATGFDLGFLARLSHMGLPEQDPEAPRLSLSLSVLFNSIAETGRIPDRIILTCLSSLLEMLHLIHLKPGEVGGTPIEGFIYNDIKPEHIFWDPERSIITLIDWGNAQLAGSGGLSRDRQYSTRDDYHQFVEAMGKFLASSAPELALRLDWPAGALGQSETGEPGEGLFQPGGLDERIRAALAEENEHLAQAHARQEYLLQPGYASQDALSQLQELHKELLGLGEIPDYPGVSQLACGYAAGLAARGDLDALREVCDWAVQLPGDQSSLWRLVARLTQISLRSQGDQRQNFLDALQAAIGSQGENVIWQMVSAIQDAPEPNWWPEVVGQVRLLTPGFTVEGLLLSTAVNRLALTLQSQVRQEEDRRERSAVVSPFNRPRTGAELPYTRSRANYGPRQFPGLADLPAFTDDEVSLPVKGDLDQEDHPLSGDDPSSEDDPLKGDDPRKWDDPRKGDDDLSRSQVIYRSLQEDILGTWWLVDPPPPHAFLDYDDLEHLLQELDSVLPMETRAVARLLDQPKAQVNRVLEAWNSKDFVSASQGLRSVLLWDPDRRRVLLADHLILSAPEWLKKVHLGPQQVESFKEFATDLEFEGRELRNHVGPASWLDAILDSLSSLRKGVWPSDLLAANPGLGQELPWLRRFERVERLPAEVKTAEDEPLPVAVPSAFDFSKAHEGIFGPQGGELRLVEPMDAWLPEARGSSARVYLGEERVAKDATRQLAVKLMRMDKVEYSLPLFREEVQVLSLMDGVPGVVRMLESGFIHLDFVGPLPLDSDLQAVRGMQGEFLRIRPDDPNQFLSQLDERVEGGWTPYLGIEKQEREDNLLFACDAGMTHGHFLPMVNLLQMVVQICEILQVAHSRNIVYRDHKLLHYYWQERSNGIFILDWNVARLHPEGLSDYEKQMDLVQFGARGLHHILTGRAAPGALPLGPTRPEEIEQAAKSYHTQWTYDDQRLSPRLRDIVEAVLSGTYTRVDALRDDLKGTFITL
jgi:serine/threonine protein kinase